MLSGARFFVRCRRVCRKGGRARLPHSFADSLEAERGFLWFCINAMEKEEEKREKQTLEREHGEQGRVLEE